MPKCSSQFAAFLRVSISFLNLEVSDICEFGFYYVAMFTVDFRSSGSLARLWVVVKDRSTNPGLYGVASRVLRGRFRCTSLRWPLRFFQKSRSASSSRSMSSYALATKGPWGFLDSCSAYLDSYMLDEISRDSLVIMIIMASGRKQRVIMNG